ncbi:MAG: CDP-glycerol glycerophosphotransferase family protein [Gammaproteobacteria bacterium]|nr:CDP-glycerol glycerophosphotransferase family protein [Gammaproteobacteria bacterium]
MNRYLLFANQLYCYQILRPLQEAIVKRGDKVAWFLHNVPNLLTENDGPLLESVKAVQEYNPTAVYVPTNWVPDFFPGIKVQVFHGFDVGKRAGTRQEHARIRGLYDLYCTQGPSTTDQFEAKAREYGNFKVTETGWTMLDPLFQPETKPTLKERLGTDKPIILFGSTFSPTYSGARTLASTIEKLSQTGRWHWLINLHPKMDTDVVETYKNMQSEHLTFIDNKQDTLPLLRTADVMLCDTSSFFLQFLILNKPVVTFNTAMPGNHLLDVHTIEEIEPAIECALSHPPELMQSIKTFADQLHPYCDGHSSERVLQATDDFIANDMGKLKPKPFNLWRKIQMRKRMKYYHW